MATWVKADFNVHSELVRTGALGNRPVKYRSPLFSGMLSCSGLIGAHPPNQKGLRITQGSWILTAVVHDTASLPSWWDAEQFSSGLGQFGSSGLNGRRDVKCSDFWVSDWMNWDVFLPQVHLYSREGFRINRTDHLNKTHKKRISGRWLFHYCYQ